VIEPRRHSGARIAFFAAVERVAAVLGGRRLYRRRALSAARLVTRTERVDAPGLTASRGRVRIVHVSDLHAGSFVGPGDLDDVVARIDALEPDLVAFTGDFISNRVEDLGRVAEDLARITAPLGVFAVFGNHDYRGRREHEIAAAIPGWTFLRNACEVVETARGARVGLAGIEDVEEGRHADVGAALGPELERAHVRIALTHGPRGAPPFAAAGFDLVLAGHTHGGQVDLPLLRRLGPAHPGLRVQMGATTLLVTRGLGPIGLPLRVGAPAEVVCIDIAPPMAQDRGSCREASDSTAASSTSDATR